MLYNLYKHSPVWVQNVMCTLSGYKEKKIRFGNGFLEYYNFLKQSEWYDEQTILDYQLNQLKSIVNYCYENVPYYTNLFDAINLSPSDINRIGDLSKIPILTKEMIRENYHSLVNPNFKKPIIKMHTSGSTGKALDFIFSKEAVKYRWALWFRHKNRFGVHPNDSYATFTGLVVVPIAQNKPPYWRQNKASKQTIFTMHHISKDKVPAIVDKLNKGGITYYSGYPSILYSLAILIEELGLQITNSPKVIFTGAEMLLDSQRKKISEIFNCLVTDQYGFSEGCGNASRCEYDNYHEDFEYGILECEKEESGEHTINTGKILATGFTNLAMPFLRYDVGDTATWVNEKCKCGRQSKVIREINGRNEDFVITPEGNKILRFDYIFKDAINVVEAQIVQKELGEVIIRIVKRKSYTKKDEILLETELHNKVSPKIKVLFEYVDEIEREITGKFRAVKSYLK